MINVSDEFKEYQGSSRGEVGGFIETLCIDWLFSTYFLQKKDISINVHFFTIEKYYYAL